MIEGAARFTVGGEDVDAAVGTLVLVRPGTHRQAVATKPGTLVLAVGGPPTFEPAGSEWLELARPHFESDPARAKALLGRGIEEAARHLELAIARDGRLRAEAEREPLLAGVARETHDSHG